MAEEIKFYRDIVKERKKSEVIKFMDLKNISTVEQAWNLYYSCPKLSEEREYFWLAYVEIRDRSIKAKYTMLQ